MYCKGYFFILSLFTNLSLMDKRINLKSNIRALKIKDIANIFFCQKKINCLKNINFELVLKLYLKLSCQ